MTAKSFFMVGPPIPFNIIGLGPEAANVIAVKWTRRLARVDCDAVNGHLGHSAEHLWQTIRTDEALLVRSRRYEAFMHLRAAVDTGDQAAIDAEREVSEKAGEVEDDLRREFAAITPEAWARFVAKKSE